MRDLKKLLVAIETSIGNWLGKGFETAFSFEKLLVRLVLLVLTLILILLGQYCNLLKG